MMWNGSFSDSEVVTTQFLLAQAAKYLQPGVINLGHANHPLVLSCFDQLVALIHSRNLTPVTLDEMFGTSRATGWTPTHPSRSERSSRQCPRPVRRCRRRPDRGGRPHPAVNGTWTTMTCRARRGPVLRVQNDTQTARPHPRRASPCSSACCCHGLIIKRPPFYPPAPRCEPHEVGGHVGCRDLPKIRMLLNLTFPIQGGHSTTSPPTT
jgi:hypothetical protein